MNSPDSREAPHPSGPEPVIPEWNSEAIGERVIDRVIHVPRWVVSEKQTHAPYVQTTMHRVIDVDIAEGGVVTFKTSKVEERDATHSDDDRTELVIRPGPPDGVGRSGNHEIWVYGDPADSNNDKTLFFNL